MVFDFAFFTLLVLKMIALSGSRNHEIFSFPSSYSFNFLSQLMSRGYGKPKERKLTYFHELFVLDK